MLLSALVGGHHDAELDSGAEADVDADADHGGDPGHSILGLRFWTHFAAAFGLTGVLLGLMGTGGLTAAIAATVTGFSAGLGISVATRFLRRTEPQSLASSQDLVGLEGKVTVAVGGKEQPGKIRCITRGEILDLTAETDDPNGIELGAEIMVVEVRESRVSIVRRGALLSEGQSIRGALGDGQKDGG